MATFALVLGFTAVPATAQPASHTKPPTWHQQATPALPAGMLGGLAGVSCPTAKECLAVGSYSGQYASGRPFALRRHDGKWRRAKVQVPRSAAGGQFAATRLRAVSCASTSFCIAVGDYARYFQHAGSKTQHLQTVELIERWSSHGWQTMSVKLPRPLYDDKRREVNSSTLKSVSCVSDTSCTAIGERNRGSRDLIFAEHWDGRRWRVERPPTVTKHVESAGELFAVSCGSTTDCFAVGDYANATGASKLLFDRRTSSGWHRLKPRLNPPGGFAGSGMQLFAASCTTSKRCTAVGYYGVKMSGGSTTDEPLVVRTNGDHVRVVRPAKPVNVADVQLDTVTCTSPGTCVIVGGGGPGVRYVIEQEHHYHWRLGSTKGLENYPGIAELSCPSIRDCIAVGDLQGQTGPWAARRD